MNFEIESELCQKGYTWNVERVTTPEEWIMDRNQIGI